MAKLNLGERIPDFKVTTASGREVGLHSLLEDKTVLWFLRYIGCPVCHYDVQVAANRYEELAAKGAKLIFVMQSDTAHINAAYAEGELPFDIICDPEQTLYRSLEILPAESMEKLAGGSFDALKEKGGKAAAMGFEHGDFEGDEQQLPAMFILAKDGTAEYVRYAENIVDLPDFDGVLALL